MSVMLALSFLVVACLGWILVSTSLIQAKKLVSAMIFERGENSFSQSVWVSLALSLLSAHPKQQLQDVKTSYQNSLWPRRQNLLWWTQSGLSALFLLWVLSSVLLQIESFYFLLISLILWAIARHYKRIEALSLFFLGMGVMLFGIEMGLKNSGLLLNAMVESPQWMIVASTGFETMGFGFAIGVLMYALFRIPLASLILVTVLLLGGVASFQFCFPLVMGEIFAFWWARLRNAEKFSFQKDLKLRISVGLGVSLICFLITPLVLWLGQTLVGDEFFPELRYQQVALGFLLWVILDTAISSIVFHFHYFRGEKPART